MLRCSVSPREVLLERAPVDEVAARARSQRHARDRRLALARRAVARARGEVDRGRGDRLGEHLLLILSSACACSTSRHRVLDRVRVLVRSRRGQSGSTPSGTMSTSRWAPGTDGFARGAGSLPPRLRVARPRLGLRRRLRPPRAAIAPRRPSSATGPCDRGSSGGLGASGGSSSRAAGLASALARPAPPRSPARPRQLGARLCARRSRGSPRRPSGLDLQRLRFLRDVRVLGPGVDLELRDLLARQPVAGHHAFDGQPDDLLRAPGQHLLERARAQPARVAGVAVVALVLALVAASRGSSPR